jgi:hypothetical protein
MTSSISSSRVFGRGVGLGAIAASTADTSSDAEEQAEGGGSYLGIIPSARSVRQGIGDVGSSRPFYAELVGIAAGVPSPRG